MRPNPGPSKMRRPVLVAMLLATGWFGAVLLAWQKYQLPTRALAVVLALAPFVAILLWSRRHPPPERPGRRQNSVR